MIRRLDKASVGGKTINGSTFQEGGKLETRPRISNSLKLVLVFIFVVLGACAFAGKAQAGGYIQGTVTDAVTGHPIPGIYVDAFEVNFGLVSSGSPPPPSTLSNTTDLKGRYSFFVYDGIYKVFFQGIVTSSKDYVGQWWKNASSFSGATPVAVAGTRFINDKIDATMTDRYGRIRGSVLEPNSDVGVDNVFVSVYDYDQKIAGKRGITGATTGPLFFLDGRVIHGYFETSDLPPGRYKLYFDDKNIGNNNLRKWWRDTTVFSAADEVMVTDSTQDVLDPFRLSEGGIIAGRVTDASNSPILNARIYVYDQNHINVSFGNYTDATGSYSIKRLPAGSYKVLFKGPSGTTKAYQWYGNQAQASFNQASWVLVVAGNTAKINAQLDMGGSITGLIIANTALADRKSQSVTGGTQAGSLTAGINATVNVYDEYRENVASGPSSADGTFSVAGLPTGKYKVEFIRSNLGSTWFNGHRTFDSADWILVNAGSTTPDVSGQLVPAAIISGKVTDTLGVAIPNVTVRVYDDATLEQLNPSAGTDSFGVYTLNSISPGSSRLYYDSHGTGYFSEWWAEKKSVTDATPINLIPGQTYPNTDAVLDPSKEVYLPLVLKN